MANELERARLYLRYYRNGEEADFEEFTEYLSVAGTEYHYSVQSIGFAAKENLTKGDVGTIGYIAMKNEDTTNFCSFGDDADAPSIELKAGESCLLRWSRSVANISALADTGATRIRYLIIED